MTLTIPVSSEGPSRGDRLAGLLLGTALGDALGLPAEGLSRQQIARRIWNGHWRHRFLFGHGNQQIGASVIARVLSTGGRDGILVVATPAKLAALGGRPLLVDTGDPAVDAMLDGHVSVVTGRRERTIYQIRPAWESLR